MDRVCWRPKLERLDSVNLDATRTENQTRLLEKQKFLMLITKANTHIRPDAISTNWGEIREIERVRVAEGEAAGSARGRR